MFSAVSVCLLTGLLNNYWSKLHEILWTGSTQFRTSRLDFEWPRPKSKGQNHFFCN